MWPNLPRWHKHQFVSGPMRRAHAFERTVDEEARGAVMAGLDPAIHLLRKTFRQE
jgi:hypothetical protein